MISTIPDVVPLEDDEKNWLFNIYKKRLWHLPIAFLMCFVSLAIYAFCPRSFVLCAYINDLFLGGKDTWLVDQHFLSGWYVKIGIAILISGVCCCLYYFNNVLPFKWDAESGVKEKVPFTVIKKEYFPVTSQYFVTLGGVSRHYEVDCDTYSNCQEGGSIIMDRAIKSKYIFCENNELRY